MLAAPAGLACRRECTLRTQATQVQPEQPAFPAQWFYGLYVISSVRRAFWPPSPCASPARLDPSVGGSGPHDFAVRKDAFVGAPKRAEHPLVHRIPLPTSVTIAIRPSCGGGMRGYDHEIPKNGSGIFFAGGVDISGYGFRLIEVICPSMQLTSAATASRSEREDRRVL